MLISNGNYFSSGAYREIDDDEDAEVKNARLSWKGLGTAPWLVDRVEALGYPLPTTIQINSFEAVNVLLSTVDQISLIRSNADDTLEERLESRSPQNFGVVISGSTGVSNRWTVSIGFATNLTYQQPTRVAKHSPIWYLLSALCRRLCSQGRESDSRQKRMSGI